MDNAIELAGFLAIAHRLTDFVLKDEKRKAEFVEFTGIPDQSESILADVYEAHDFYEFMAATIGGMVGFPHMPEMLPTDTPEH